MLPATPLHHLLLCETGFPVVATSGNRTDEPICTDEREALVRLGGMADLFLVHDRPIARHVDDSVARVFAGAPRLLRRARGCAPLPVPVRADLPVVLGVGAHMKTAVALSVGTAGLPLAAHRRPRDARGARRLRERDRGLREAVGRDARPPSPTTSTPGTRRRSSRSGSPRNAASRPSPSSTTTRTSPRASPRTRSTARHSASRGTARASGRTGRSGEASSSSATRPASRASRTSGRSGCPAATRPCGSRGGRRSRSSSRSSGRGRSLARTSSRCARSTRGERDVLARMLERSVNAPVDDERGASLRRGRLAPRNRPEDFLRRSGGDGPRGGGSRSEPTRDARAPYPSPSSSPRARLPFSTGGRWSSPF